MLLPPLQPWWQLVVLLVAVVATQASQEQA
jgi:hypothetical protein